MTDEYTARERALTLAHKDADNALPVDDIIALAEKYLAFLLPEAASLMLSGARLTPEAIRVIKDANDTIAFIDTHLRQNLHNGGIAG